MSIYIYILVCVYIYIYCIICIPLISINGQNPAIAPIDIVYTLHPRNSKVLFSLICNCTQHWDAVNQKIARDNLWSNHRPGARRNMNSSWRHKPSRSTSAEIEDVDDLLMWWWMSSFGWMWCLNWHSHNISGYFSSKMFGPGFLLRKAMQLTSPGLIFAVDSLDFGPKNGEISHFRSLGSRPHILCSLEIPGFKGLFHITQRSHLSTVSTNGPKKMKIENLYSKVKGWLYDVKLLTLQFAKSYVVNFFLHSFY